MLDARLKELLIKSQKNLLREGTLPSQERLKDCYTLFQSRFGPDVLGALEGENLLNFMHARPSKDTLMYWLEFKHDGEFPTKSLGSISGGSAFKFGLHYKQDTGTWIKGSSNKQVPISAPEAASLAEQQRDQLIAAAKLLDDLPENASDAQYLTLQKELDKLAHDATDSAWGHKYLSLLYPTKLDDYHNPEYQHYHLIKLLQTPPRHRGRYAPAGQFVRIARELEMPINHLTTILNQRNPKPRRYWRIGTKLGQEGEDIWPLMRDNGFAAIGWAELGNLADIKDNDDFRLIVCDRLCEKYEKKRNVASRKSGEIHNFVNGISEGDLVLAADGRRILGIGRMVGDYEFEETLNSDAPNRRKVDWLSVEEWNLPTDEGLQTTCLEIKHDVENLIETERRLLNAAQSERPAPRPAPGNFEQGRHEPPAALNTILYGPPGTGKTHHLRTYYQEKFTDRRLGPTEEERATSLIKDMSWWEVIALTLLDIKDNKASVAQILDHPLARARLKLSANKNPRAMLWSSLQLHTKNECPNVNHTNRSDPLLFWKDEHSIWSIDAKLANAEVPELGRTLHAFHNPPKGGLTAYRFKFTTFHQSFSYEDFVEGIKPQTEDREDGQLAYEVRPGIFKELCAEARENPDKNYAIFIDEINRGNVASIFGELITLIEEDKRLGAKNALTIKLPYSRDDFGVPSNLYIIGTMNTADRSVEALDTALRRRFTFEEMRPDAKHITQPADLPVDLHKLFATINARIEQLLDRDHCIGHSYFMEITSLASLRSAFKHKIIPLVQEYFYGNPAKAAMVLGERFVSPRSERATFAPGDWGSDEPDEKAIYEFKDVSAFSAEDFASVYDYGRPGI
ncbi:MAG TPA: AAA family ATPase [Candidatus Dormibacteraeota bacterium]|nr:AAA family ATPase [Candidatus Dormibacteraeota bacterium]